MLPEVRRTFKTLQQRIMLMVARASLTGTSDTGQMQTLQLGVLDGETRDNVERFQNYGLTSHPLPGAEAAVVFAGGNRDHGLVLAVDDRRYRVKGLQAGEVAIYTDEGDKIVLKRGRLIEVTTQTLRINAETKVEINSPEVELNTTTTTVNASNSATLNSPQSYATGQLSDQNGTMQEMRDTYNGHNHGGVQPGGGNTNNPNQSMT